MAPCETLCWRFSLTSTLPPMQQHTVAKHHILEYHLKEWFAILGRSNNILRYIDGFAGPGEYQGGEPGSPILALETVRKHQAFEGFIRQGKTMEFLFVERKGEFYQSLKHRVENNHWPSNFKIDIESGEFDRNLNRLLEKATASERLMPPTLLFVDPFGSAGFPMALFEKLSSFDRVDVLINLNHSQFVQWILPDPRKHITADKLYGGPRWTPAISMVGEAQGQFLVDEYESALQEFGWLTTSFEMVNQQNQRAYHLVFGSGSTKGLEAIKRAMRHASQTGEFRYSDRIDSAQPVLLGLDMAEQYPIDIGEMLFDKYEGQEVTLDRLMEEEILRHRWWIESDLKAGLRYLEYGDIPRISSVRYYDGRTRKSRTYPKGCYVTFGRPSRPEQGQLL